LSQVVVNIPEAFHFLFTPSRYKIIYGGRGSGKTKNVALALILKAYQKPLSILCGREYQKSLEDSVMRELANAITTLNLQKYFDVQHNCIKGKNGSYFAFTGFAKNPESLKSLSDFDICWIEEADTVSKNSWTTLVPTFRKNTSEIWATLNPKMKDDFIYGEFIATDTPPRNAIIVKVNYNDNPYFPQVLEDDRLEMLIRDPDLYKHVWEGEILELSSSRVFPHVSIEDMDDIIYTTHPRPEPNYGLDFGLSVDPAVLAETYLFNHNGQDTVYIKEIWYRKNLHVDEYVPLLREIPNLKNYALITADSSRPELIAHIKKYQYNIKGCKKYPGSLNEGVEHLKQFNIVIHPSCREAITEFLGYKYKMKNDEILPEIDQKNDHVIDAVRYSLERYRKRTSSSLLSIPIEIRP
jgi:phage terminase large subunit